MKNQRGGIRLSTLIGIVLILALILFSAVVFMRLNSNNSGNENVVVNENTYNTSTNENASSGENTSESENTSSNDNTSNINVLTDEEFTLSFLKNENDKNNLIYSPLSIKYALKMLQDGASGNTLSQIEKATKNLSLTKYTDKKDVLSLANSIFIRDTYFPKVKQTYKDILVSRYNAEIIQDKFESAKNINNWIENKTLGIIKNMLKDEQVQNPTCEMLLVNALAIDMEWQSRFDDKDTYGKTFYKADGKEMQATTMNKKTTDNSASYYVGNNVTAVSMDLLEYEGTQMEFMAIMPDSDLEKYAENVTLEKIEEITKNLKLASNTKAGIVIEIPKFSFEYDLDLKTDLKKLGITDAFDGVKADFTNMVDIDRNEENIYVSEALHKANIDFTEKGVKAAAVTVFIMEKNAMVMPEQEQPIEVKFDKPFLFLIRDKKTKEIWFVGTMYEPNNWENDKAEYKR